MGKSITSVPKILFQILNIILFLKIFLCNFILSYLQMIQNTNEGKIMKPLTLIVIFLGLMLANVRVLAQDAKDVLQKQSKDFFIENKGQWQKEVKYLARINGLSAWITDYGIVYDYHKIIRDSNQTKSKNNFSKFSEPDENTRIKGQVLKMTFVNAQPPEARTPNESKSPHIEADDHSKYEGNGKKEGYYNYFIGNDSTKWASNVGLYDEAIVKDIYKGIDVRYYYDRSVQGRVNLRYDFIINPGADISQIKIKLEGADKFDVNSEGELIIQTSIGEIKHNKLYTYQIDKDFDFSNLNKESQSPDLKENKKTTQIQCKFVKNPDGTIGFAAENYDHKKKLVIDPLVYSTFLGGGADDQGLNFALDSAGSAYIVGTTRSVNFPTTSGAYNIITNGVNDVFITKLNPSSSGLIYSTYIGGELDDYGYSIAIDNENNIFITGSTYSYNFPTTFNAFSINKNLYSDVFVTKLNASGSDLIYSTFIGGNQKELGFSIAINQSGNAFITGVTSSLDYPTTNFAFNTSYNGGFSDAFVTVLDANGSDLIYSTYIGGSDEDRSYCIVVDQIGNVYITGDTYSTNYPTTIGAYNISMSGARDIFVTKLNQDGTGLIYSTFIGGTTDDLGKSIKIDNFGNLYITGTTNSSNYPVTAGAYDMSYNGYGAFDVFVTKLNPLGTGLIFSTFIGGNSGDDGTALTFDCYYNIFITGNTCSINYPTTFGAYSTNKNGDNPHTDAFITKLNQNGTTLLYSTFIGGLYSDFGNDIIADEFGDPIIVGKTSSTNYPTTIGAFDTSYNGNSYDAIVTRLHENSFIPIGPILISPANNLTNQQINPSLHWHTALFAISYKLQISTDSSFVTTIINQTGITDTSYLISGLSYSTKYFWRVQAIKNTINSQWSKIWNFTTQSNPWIIENDSTDNSALVIVLTNINPTIGSRPFMAGDAVGLFYTRDGELHCGGYSVWNDLNIGITVWGDDNQTTIKDGFSVGEEFTFKIWDNIVQVEYMGIATFASGPTTFQKYGIITLASLTTGIALTENLNLSLGWNLISSFINPTDTQIENMFSPIAANINVIKNKSGQFWIPGVVNTIGNWNINEGYQINMNTPASITIHGTQIVPEANPIALISGWNIISYLRNSSMSIVSALAGITNNIVIVKNNSGEMYIPGVVNTIGNMLPGQGYHIYLLSGCVLTYPGN